MTAPFDAFLERVAELANLSAAQALLNWDQETFMPPGSQAARAQQAATIGAIAHQKLTCDEMGKLLEKLQGGDAPEDVEKRTAVERVAWDYARATRVPETLVREVAVAQSDAVACWTAARPANDFPRFRPYLEKLLELERRRAECLSEKGRSLYDALLEGYERGASGDGIETLFARLRDAIMPLVRRIAESGNAAPTACIEREFDPLKQWEFGIEVLRVMGFDFQRGRQDRSAHPFTSGLHPTDVRITTRIASRNLAAGLFSTIHEGGHALYEQGIAPADYRTPLGSAVSLGIHESQSRLWENLVGRGLPFWRHFYPQLRKVFPAQFRDVSLETFHRAINAVRPSLIRVEADEITYSLHIILRFELERDLLEGRLSPAGLPDAWREKMKRYLGIEPPDDKDGCMQDIHWAWGLIGYFPTYTLGNLYAAQFYNKAVLDVPDLEERIAKGELAVLTEWLREKIHRVGHRRLANELAEDVTGHPLRSEPFIEYLGKKYAALYAL